jgi:hypothetical protein
MLYSVQRLYEKRLAVVLVERRDLTEPRASWLIEQLQYDLTLPVILVSRDSEVWTGVRARAEFDPEPYVYALLGVRDIDWSPLNCTCTEFEGA